MKICKPNKLKLMAFVQFVELHNAQFAQDRVSLALAPLQGAVFYKYSVKFGAKICANGKMRRIFDKKKSLQVGLRSFFPSLPTTTSSPSAQISGCILRRQYHRLLVTQTKISRLFISILNRDFSFTSSSRAA